MPTLRFGIRWATHAPYCCEVEKVSTFAGPNSLAACLFYAVDPCHSDGWSLVSVDLIVSRAITLLVIDEH